MNVFLLLMKQEWALTLLIFILLFIKINGKTKNETLLPLVQVLLLLNFLSGFFLTRKGVLFGGMFYTDGLIALQKNILNLGVYFISLVCADWLKRSEHLAEFLLLMLSSLLGMFFMLSARHLLLFYLSLELSTLPVAAMANFDLHKKRSSEAAMKMILNSAFASGVFLLGASLLYGATGTLSFSELSLQVNENPFHIFCVIFLVAAFGFKLSAVPFHLWTADVYEGSPIAATSFLSVISKGAFAFVFMTFLYRLMYPLADSWEDLLMILSLSTIVIGNLFALRQQNIKRFLAFSSIAQVGFILVALSSYSTQGIISVIYFILIYTFSNLAAFGVASVIAAKSGKENINDYKGLNKTNPFLSWIMALALFSLAGIPPTAGFFGKLFLISAAAQRWSYGFIIFIALNLVVSLYYYLRIVRAMFMDKNEDPIEAIKTGPAVKFGLLICAAGIVLIGFLSWIYDYIISFIQ
jgi:NADH-quinone oxidoreductase subunit N